MIKRQMNKKEDSCLLPIKGAYNMRDLGGYQTNNGKHVKYKTIIRSGDLNELTTDDLRYLSEIPLITDIDFRSEQEKEAAPDKHPDSIKEYIWLPINAGDMNDLKIKEIKSISQMMEDAYKTIIDRFRNEYKEFFQILMAGNKTPLLFHCSAGKDRTGIAAALILSALGVSKETILEDYMLSAQYLKGKYDYLIRIQPSLEPLTTVRPEYLQAALQLIDEEFGGMDSFLTKTLGVDIERMKELYTE